MWRAPEGANGHRLRKRIRQSRPGAGASRDLCALAARDATPIGARRAARRTRPRLRPLAAPDHRPVPGQDGDESAPLALFIHGGWWRSLSPTMFSHIAKGPNARGVTVAVAGYDLCPQVSIAAIIDQMRAACLCLWRKYRKRILVYGHSAGGHLAACMVAQDWKAFAADAPDDLVPAAYAISGVFDLAPLLQRVAEPGPAARRGRGAARVAALLAGAGRTRRSTRWWARSNRANSCARARPSPTPGGRAWRRRATRRSPAPTISPCSTRSPTRKAR